MSQPTVSLIKMHDLPMPVRVTPVDTLHPMHMEALDGLLETHGGIDGPCGWWALDGVNMLTDQGYGETIFTYASEADMLACHTFMFMLDVQALDGLTGHYL